MLGNSTSYLDSIEDDEERKREILAINLLYSSRKPRAVNGLIRTCDEIWGARHVWSKFDSLNPYGPATSQTKIYWVRGVNAFEPKSWKIYLQSQTQSNEMDLAPYQVED